MQVNVVATQSQNNPVFKFDAFSNRTVLLLSPTLDRQWFTSDNLFSINVCLPNVTVYHVS